MTIEAVESKQCQNITLTKVTQMLSLALEKNKTPLEEKNTRLHWKRRILSLIPLLMCIHVKYVLVTKKITSCLDLMAFGNDDNIRNENNYKSFGKPLNKMRKFSSNLKVFLSNIIV